MTIYRPRRPLKYVPRDCTCDGLRVRIKFMGLYGRPLLTLAGFLVNILSLPSLHKSSLHVKFCWIWQKTHGSLGVPDFIKPENWPSNSPDLNLVDYSVWRELQQMVYRHKISDIDRLKRMPIDCCIQLSQDTLNRAIYQLPKRLIMVIKAGGAHVEFLLD